MTKSKTMYKVRATVAEDLEAVVFRCWSSVEEVTVLKSMRQVLPPHVSLRRSAEGIRVAYADELDLLSSSHQIDINWSEAAERFKNNRKHANHFYHGIRERLRTLLARGSEYAASEVSDSAGIDVLDSHQLVNVAAMTIPDGFGICLFDEQGAGKTVSMIYAFDLLASRAQADQLIIVAPKSMLPEWPKDIMRFRPGLYRIASITGSPREKRLALSSRADIFVTNFETVVAMEAYFESLLRRRPDRNVLVVDESFLVKSPTAKRTRALRRLREWCGRAFVLCGTPAPNSPLDLVEQCRLVDFGISFKNVRIPNDRENALPIIKRVIEDRCLYVRHTKADVLPDLPAKQFHRVFVPMQPEQADLYERTKVQLIADVRSVSDATFRREYASFLAQRTALLQICSNPISIDGNYTEIPAKIKLLDELLDRWIRRDGQKVVLWSFYRASIEFIASRYADFGVLRYDGTVTDVSQRGEAVRRFQEDEDMRLFVANPAAAGAGLTLHRARIAVYESLSAQAAQYLQSLDRIHRRGQERDVEYVIMLCQDSIEVREYERLVQKEDSAAQLLGDVIGEPVARQTFLSDISSDFSLEDRVAS